MTSDNLLPAKEEEGNLSDKSPLLSLAVQKDDKPLAPPGLRGIVFFLKLCSWWFAYSAMIGPLPSIIWPAQIESIVGSEHKEKWNGILPSFGAFVSLVTTPIAGMLSDRSNSRIGRRKIYLISGSIIGLAFYLLCGTAEKFDKIWVFALFTIGLQFGINLAAGPYAGLIPDCVHDTQVGKASGFNGLGAALGYLCGFGAAAVFATDTSTWQVYVVLGAFFSIFTLPTILGVREPFRDKEHAPLTLKSFAHSFYLDPQRYRSFYWVILTRLLEQMGYYTVLPFFQYFIQDVIYDSDKDSEEEAKLYSSILLGIIVILCLPSSIIAGSLSDRFGRKPMVIISMAIMSSGVGAMVGLIYYRYMPLLFICAGVFGIGYGSFLAVDWALALDALPEGADVAKDMGIWHIAFVLPQVIAPIITGQLLNHLKQVSYQFAYTIVFTVACFWFIIATLFVLPIKLKPKKAIPQEE